MPSNSATSFKLSTLSRCIAGILLLSACQSSEKSVMDSNALPTVSVDQLMLVDCMLPGQVKQLGTKMTYLTPRRPARLTASECAIRGGEYTMYDRANLNSSLNVWTPLAQQGDADAQFYLGQIYENGINGQPDYQLAAIWYQRAAEQGQKSAQVNLGFLYESGLGVEKDKAKALNLYRQAADLTDDSLDYSSVIEQKVAEQVESWKQKYQQQLKQTKLHQTKVSELSQQLAKAQQLAHERPANNNAGLMQTIADLRQQLSQEQSALSQLRQQAREARHKLQLELNGISTENTQLKTLLASKSNELQLINAKLAQLNQEYQAQKSDVLSKTEVHSSLDQKHQKLLNDYAKKQLALNEAQNQINNYQSQLAFYQENIAKLNEKLESKSISDEKQTQLYHANIDALKLELSQTQSLINQQEGLVNNLSNQNEQLKKQLKTAKNALKAQQAIEQSVAELNQQHRELVKVDQSKLQLSARVATLRTTDFERISQMPANANNDLGFGNFHALIIGNDSYEFLPNLNTAVSDAKAVEEVLRTEYGYQTTLLLNTSRDTMLTEIFKLQQRLDKDSNLLIYYAGHGEIRDSRGYWLLSNASAQNSYNWVPTQQVTDLVSQFDARKIIIIADSCYSGILTRRSVLSPGIKIDIKNDKYTRWLNAMAKGKSRTVLTSGGLQPVLDGGGGQHSIFAKHLLSALKTNRHVMDAHTLFNQIFPDVKEEAVTLNVEQSPQYAPIKNANHYSVDYFFIRQG